MIQTESTPESAISPMLPTIGVFDSGFGGLTVLRAPHPSASPGSLRLPRRHGPPALRLQVPAAPSPASPPKARSFWSAEQGAQYLVIACNTASALALDAIKEAVPVPVLGVIEPGAEAARAASHTGDVLVIATDATVQSHAYAAACAARGLRALEMACPLLVPLVEEGWTSHPVNAQVIRVYLDQLLAEAAAPKPQSRHPGPRLYPLPVLRPLLDQAVPAGTARHRLRRSRGSGRRAPVRPHSFLPPPASPPRKPFSKCFATDSVEKFVRLGSRFLDRPVGNVELVDLGG